MDDHFDLGLLQQLLETFNFNTGKTTPDMIRVCVGNAGIGKLHVILRYDGEDLVNVPSRVHHGYLSSFKGTHKVDKVLHGTHFNLFEIEMLCHFTFEAREA